MVSRHLPEPEGSAAGRVLLAGCEGLRALGHEVSAWSWRPEPPADPLPAWCDWRPLPPEPAWRTRGRALARPRTDVVRAGWRPPADAVAVADDPLSAVAVAGHPRSVVTLHYATALDLRVRRPRLADLQDLRAERAAVGSARVALAYSPRVAAHFGGRPFTVPMPLAMPPEPLPAVERPVAVLLADARWPPNALAIERLHRAWPHVQAAVPGAQLFVAGPGTPTGPVARSVDLLEQAAVLAFPCPPSSGPKVKVLEALAYGVAVVTTPAGVEGLHLPAGGAVVADDDGFAAALAAALADPERRQQVAATGRAAALAAHAPVPAAQARLAVVAARLG